MATFLCSGLLYKRIRRCLDAAEDHGSNRAGSEARADSSTAVLTCLMSRYLRCWPARIEHCPHWHQGLMKTSLGGSMLALGLLPFDASLILL